MNRLTRTLISFDSIPTGLGYSELPPPLSGRCGGVPKLRVDVEGVASLILLGVVDAGEVLRDVVAALVFVQMLALDVAAVGKGEDNFSVEYYYFT